MMPALRAAELRRADGGNFLAELETHLLRGCVVSNDRIFAMARPMPRGAEPSLDAEWPAAKCDAWFIWVAVGELRELLAALPYPLPFIGWHRQGRAWARNHWRATRTVLAKAGAFSL